MRKLFYLLVAAMPLLAVACGDSGVDKPVAKQPVIRLSTSNMEFLADGGTATISYTIENPVEGVSLAVTCDAEWICDLTVGEDVSFVVAENEGAKRVTKILFKYGDVAKEVNVKQLAAGNDFETHFTVTSPRLMEFSSEGGQGAITYEIENPIHGAAVEAVCDAAWISDITIGEEIEFVVAKNEGEGREATISVRYDTFYTDVAIVQSAEGENTTVEYTMSWARRVSSSEYGQSNSYYYINFGDADETLLFSLAIYGGDSSSVLGAGTYSTVSEDLLTVGTSLSLFATGEIITFKTGRATVAVEEDNYLFDIYLTSQGNKTYHIVYEGEVEKMAVAPIGSYNFYPTAVEAVSWAAPGNFTLKFYLNDYYCHELDVYDDLGASFDYLSEGTYYFDDETYQQYIGGYGNRFVTDNGQTLIIVDAQLEITHNNKQTTTIRGFIESESGHIANIDWTGRVINFDLSDYVAPSRDVDFKATHFAGDFYSASSLHWSANNYYFTLSDAEIDRGNPVPNSTYFYFDLYSDVATEDFSIPQGTYTYDPMTTWASGTLNGGKTYGFKINSSGDDYAQRYLFTSGEVVVGDNTIVAHFVTEDGRTINISYEGSLILTNSSTESEVHYSTLTSDLDVTMSNMLLSASYYGDYYTSYADNWDVRLYEDPDKLSGVFLYLDLLADPSGDWHQTYHVLPTADFSDPDKCVNSFLAGYINEGRIAGSWYCVLDGQGAISYTMAPIVDGTISVVSNADGSTSITLDCMEDNGHKITGTVTGSASLN